MKKNVLSSGGKKIIVASLIFASLLLGGVLGGYYLFLNNNQESSKLPICTQRCEKVKEKPILDQSGQILNKYGPKFYQVAHSDYKDRDNFWLNDKEEDMLINKINTELSYGPEFNRLRSITIGDENMTGTDANGVYFPTLNQIYINLENFKDIIDSLRGKYIENIPYTENLLSQIKVNLIFETIFHEYTHHIAFSYLTNEWDGSAQQDTSIFVETIEGRKPSNWNKNFTTQFKKYLNYSGWNGKKYTDEIQTFGESKYKSIGSLYSQQDLFNHANGKQMYDFKKMDDSPIPYMFAPKSNFIQTIPLEIPKDQLSYYYSMDELFVRKYQQLNQIYNPIKNIPTFLEGAFAFNLNQNYGAISGLSDILINTLLYQNGFGNVIQNKNNQDFRLQDFKFYNQNSKFFNYKDKNSDPLFATPDESNRFLYDAPFNNDEYEYEDIKGKKFRAADHHKDLYNLMDDFLGHSSGADISIVWPKNSLTPLNNSEINIEESDGRNANYLFRFGGYIKTDDYDSIGYKDQNGDYQELSKITTKGFNYKHKDKLGAIEHVNLDPNKENYFYTTNEFIHKDYLIGKKLFFKKNNQQLESLKTVREGQNTGTNSTWYTHFSDIWQNIQKYSFVVDNTGSVVFKEIP